MASGSTAAASAELSIRQVLKHQTRVVLHGHPEETNPVVDHSNFSAPYTVIDFAFDEKVRRGDEAPELRCRVEVVDANGWMLSFQEDSSFTELLTQALKAQLVGLVVE